MSLFTKTGGKKRFKKQSLLTGGGVETVKERALMLWGENVRVALLKRNRKATVQHELTFISGQV